MPDEQDGLPGAGDDDEALLDDELLPMRCHENETAQGVALDVHKHYPCARTAAMFIIIYVCYSWCSLADSVGKLYI